MVPGERRPERGWPVRSSGAAPGPRKQGPGAAPPARGGAGGRRGADDLAVGARVRGFARRAAPADATFEAGVAGAGIGGGHGRGEGEGYRWGFDGGEAGGLG